MLGDWSSFEKDLPGIGYRNPVDYTDEGGLAGTVGAQQAENLSFRNLEAYVVEGHLLPETLADILAFNN